MFKKLLQSLKKESYLLGLISLDIIQAITLEVQLNENNQLIIIIVVVIQVAVTLHLQKKQQNNNKHNNTTKNNMQLKCRWEKRRR